MLLHRVNFLIEHKFFLCNTVTIYGSYIDNKTRKKMSLVLLNYEIQTREAAAPSRLHVLKTRHGRRCYHLRAALP